MFEEIINLFEKISKTTIDGKKDQKEKAIIEWLEENNFQWEYIPYIGLRINPLDKPKNIVVSHLDLINLFQRGFQNGKTFEITKEYIIGALDNTLTNAIALIAMKYGNSKETELLLTEGEERGLIGMSNYIKKFNKKSKETFFINLDVTNDGVGTHASIEYDRPIKEILEDIKKSMERINCAYTQFRVCDDTDAINFANCYGFSYCIPTEGLIHSYDNRTKIECIEPYTKGLMALINRLELKEKMTPLKELQVG